MYSHSKLWLYENCPEAYKVKYIDRAWPDLPESINLFLGSIVHEALEWLYHRVLEGNVPEMDELVKYYAENWQRNFKADFRIPAGEKEGDFFNKGVKFLVDYYQTNKPFDERTIEIEKKVLFPLDEEYAIQGYVDRIVLNKDGEYEIHDYKTNDRMKSQSDVDLDRQLALYHLGLKHLYGGDIKVKLVWHMLAHNKKVQSIRTDEQLEKLKQDVLALISKIESTTVWPACGKPWCDWCAYKRQMKFENGGNHSLGNWF
ncbi:MAG: RecB family exonuclease [Candidatus Hodarchaeota archaeon]